MSKRKDITVKVQRHEHLRRKEKISKGVDRETSRAYQRRNLSGGGKCEPNDPLTGNFIINNFREPGPVRIATHLFPEEKGQPKFTTIETTQNEQASEHDQK
jgi:hypothetical protein